MAATLPITENEESELSRWWLRSILGVMIFGFVILIAAMNLRGVREASKAFAIPTYVFIGSIGVMIVTALIRTAIGFAPVAESAQ